MFIAGKDMPINKNVKNNTDVLLRQLDCAVIENLHEERRGNGEFLFDSVRGIFFEGNAIYKMLIRALNMRLSMSLFHRFNCLMPMAKKKLSCLYEV